MKYNSHSGLRGDACAGTLSRWRVVGWCSGRWPSVSRARYSRGPARAASLALPWRRTSTYVHARVALPCRLRESGAHMCWRGHLHRAARVGGLRIAQLVTSPPPPPPPPLAPWACSRARACAGTARCARCRVARLTQGAIGRRACSVHLGPRSRLLRAGLGTHSEIFGMCARSTPLRGSICAPLAHRRPGAAFACLCSGASAISAGLRCSLPLFRRLHRPPALCPVARARVCRCGSLHRPRRRTSFTRPANRVFDTARIAVHKSASGRSSFRQYARHVAGGWVEMTAGGCQ